MLQNIILLELHFMFFINKAMLHSNKLEVL